MLLAVVFGDHICEIIKATKRNNIIVLSPVDLDNQVQVWDKKVYMASKKLSIHCQYITPPDFLLHVEVCGEGSGRGWACIFQGLPDMTLRTRAERQSIPFNHD